MHKAYTGTYWYVLVHTGMYQYITVCTHFINVQTCTCQYEHVHTSTYAYMQFLSLFKKLQTGLEPANFCIPPAEFTPALQGTYLNTGENS